MLFWFLSSLLIPNSCSSVFTLLNFCSKTVTQNILKCCGFSVYNLETSPFHFLHRSTLFLRRHLQTSLSVETPVSLHPSVRPSLQQTRRPSKPIIDGDLPSPWTLLSHPQHSSSLSSSWHKGLMTKELKEWPKHKEHTLIWVMTKAAGNELSPTVHKHKGSLREFLQKKKKKWNLFEPELQTLCHHPCQCWSCPPRILSFYCHQWSCVCFMFILSLSNARLNFSVFIKLHF